MRGGKRTEIVNASAFLDATAVVRTDGVFIFRMRIDPFGGLDAADLDELAYVVSMVLKERLNHTHYHHAMPGQFEQHPLHPTQILVVSPVRLRERGVASVFSEKRLTDARLRRLTCFDCPGGNAPRSALAQFRYQYIKIDEFVSFRIKKHRINQNNTHWIYKAVAPFAWSLLSATLIVGTILPPTRLEHYFILFLGILSCSVAIFLRQRIAKWDVPVVRLCRTAHGFFTKADILNDVIDRVVPIRCGGMPVFTFSVILANLDSRIAGEQHRIQMGQAWLALSVALTTFFLAIYAVTVPTEKDISPREPEIYLVASEALG